MINAFKERFSSWKTKSSFANLHMSGNVWSTKSILPGMKHQHLLQMI